MMDGMIPETNSYNSFEGVERTPSMTPPLPDRMVAHTVAQLRQDNPNAATDEFELEEFARFLAACQWANMHHREHDGWF